MTNNEIEVLVKSLIDKLDKSGSLKNQITIYNDDASKILKFDHPLNEDTTDETLLVVRIYYRTDKNRIVITIDNMYVWGDVINADECFVNSPVPSNEEEYFQYSTVNDLIFSLEFYQYLIDLFENRI